MAAVICLRSCRCYTGRGLVYFALEYFLLLFSDDNLVLKAAMDIS